jgi:hypothetical protein
MNARWVVRRRWLKPGAFLMTRRMLLGIKQRAEQRARERRQALEHAA